MFKTIKPYLYLTPIAIKALFSPEADAQTIDDRARQEFSGSKQRQEQVQDSTRVPHILRQRGASKEVIVPYDEKTDRAYIGDGIFTLDPKFYEGKPDTLDINMDEIRRMVKLPEGISHTINVYQAPRGVELIKTDNGYAFVAAHDAESGVVNASISLFDSRGKRDRSVRLIHPVFGVTDDHAHVMAEYNLLLEDYWGLRDEHTDLTQDYGLLKFKYEGLKGKLSDTEQKVSGLEGTVSDLKETVSSLENIFSKFMNNWRIEPHVSYNTDEAWGKGIDAGLWNGWVIGYNTSKSETSTDPVVRTELQELERLPLYGFSEDTTTTTTTMRDENYRIGIPLNRDNTLLLYLQGGPREKTTINNIVSGTGLQDEEGTRIGEDWTKTRAVIDEKYVNFGLGFGVRKGPVTFTAIGSIPFDTKSTTPQYNEWHANATIGIDLNYLFRGSQKKEDK